MIKIMSNQFYFMNQTQQKNNQNPKANTSLSSSKIDDTENSKLSLVIAMNRLKQTENQIYQAKKRLQIMQMRQSSFQYRSLNKSRARQYHEEARNFVDKKKNIKMQYLARRSFEIEKSHQKSMQSRRKHKEKIQQIKQMLQKNNRSNYESARVKRQEHQKEMLKHKNQVMTQKKNNRLKMFQEEQKRHNYMKEYLKNKELGTRLQKEEETLAVQSRIMERQMILEKLEKLGSEASRANLNPQSRQSRSGSEEKNSDDLQKSCQRKGGFRVKYYKNQPTILLE